MEPEPVNGQWRLRAIERRLDRVEERTEGYAVLAAEHKNLQAELHDLSAEVKSLRRALYTTALSVTSGAVIFALSILAVIK